MQSTTPSNFKQLTIITKYEFLKYIRAKKIHAMFIVGLSIPILLVLLSEYFDADIPENPEIYVSGLLGSLFFIQVISTAFFGSGMIVSEFHDKTGYALFPNPVKRSIIWGGKFIAASIASAQVVALYFIVISLTSLFKFNQIPIEIIYSLFFSLLVTLSLTCIVFLASSIFRSPTSALVVIILLFIVVFPMVDQLLITLAEIKPWFTPSFSSGVTKNLLKVPYPSNLDVGQLPRGPFDFERFVPYVWESISIQILYLITCGIASVLLFRRMEMK